MKSMLLQCVRTVLLGCSVILGLTAPVVTAGDPPPLLGPTIQLVAPAEGTTFLLPTAIELVAETTGFMLPVMAVEFLAGERVIGEALASTPEPDDPGILPPPQTRFSFVWEKALPGQYALRARVRNSAGMAIVSKPIHIIVTGPDTSLPVVTIEAWDPVAAELTLTDAMDTGWFRLTRTGSLDLALSVGLSVEGTAESGVDYEALPTLAVIPRGEASLDLEVRPIPDKAIERAETVLVTIGPPPMLDDGTVPWTARYRVGEPAKAVVTIRDQSPGLNQPPEVKLVAPPNDSVFPLEVDIVLVAQASDPDGEVVSVEFFANGQSLGVKPNLPVMNPLGPFVLAWQPELPGEYELTAVALDNAGANSTSPAVHVGVKGGDFKPVVVNIMVTDPEAVESNTRCDEATGERCFPDTATFRIARRGAVDFELPVFLAYAGTAENGIDYATLPESVVIPRGESQVELTIRPLYDGVAERRESVVVEVLTPACIEIYPPPPTCYRVGEPARAMAHISDPASTENLPPRVHLMAPEDGGHFAAPATVFLVAEARDPDGKVTQVEFFANDQSLGVRKPSPVLPAFGPFTFAWKEVKPGDYSLTARATDDRGATTTSAAVRIVVTEAQSTATITFDEPADGARFTAPADIAMKATAIDPSGYIAQVVFYANDVQVGLSELWFFAMPEPGTPIEHHYLWQQAPPGDYALTARTVLADGTLLASKPVHIIVAAQPNPSFVHRILPPNYAPGQECLVTLEAQPPAGTSSYGIEELPPAGWTFAPVQTDQPVDQGTYDPVTHKVKFGPYADDQARTLTYRMLAPTDAQRPQFFRGLASADGVNSLVTGDARIDALWLHPADANPGDHSMALDEVTAYGKAWKKGEAWPTPPNPIPADFLTRAAALWLGGETYTYDPKAGLPPLCWVNPMPPPPPAPEPPPTLKADGLLPGQSTRSLPGAFVAGLPFEVVLNVTPLAAFAVEERVPKGWTVSGMTEDGLFDAAGNVVRWGPFFETTPRVLRYQVTPPADAMGFHRFAGLVSWNGCHRLVGGSCVIASNEAPPAFDLVGMRKMEDGAAMVLLNPETAPVVEYVIEVSEDLVHWTPAGRTTRGESSLFFLDPAATGGTRFYRAVIPH